MPARSRSSIPTGISFMSGYQPQQFVRALLGCSSERNSLPSARVGRWPTCSRHLRRLPPPSARMPLVSPTPSVPLCRARHLPECAHRPLPPSTPVVAADGHAQQLCAWRPDCAKPSTSSHHAAVSPPLVAAPVRQQPARALAGAGRGCVDYIQPAAAAAAPTGASATGATGPAVDACALTAAAACMRGDASRA